MRAAQLAAVLLPAFVATAPGTIGAVLEATRARAACVADTTCPLGRHATVNVVEQNPPSSQRITSQLPPDIMLDSYLLRAEQSIRDGDQGAARVAMEQLVALQEEHDLVPVATYHYRYARVWNAVGAWTHALASATRYLQLAGREGDHYLDALMVMNQSTAAIERADREGERRAAEEARRRAATERARLELERTLNAARDVLSQMEFAYIPEGQFRMSPSAVHLRGSTRDHPASYYQRPDVRITRSFEIGRYEVTRWEWEMVMGSTVGNANAIECPRCPVTYIEWDEIQRFISFLNSAEGNAQTYRLPTEAEWEYAARAGENGERFVRDLEESAWYMDNHDSSGNAWAWGLNPVGLKRPNAFGLYDMIGNAAELVQDWWGYYPGGTTVEDPTGPPSAYRFPGTTGRTPPRHTVRGCAYLNGRELCERGGWREGVYRRLGSIGFRVVRASQ